MLDRHYSPAVIRLLKFLSYAMAVSLGGFSLAVFIVGDVSLGWLVPVAVMIAYFVAFNALEYWFLAPRRKPEANAIRRKMAPPIIILWVIATPLWIIGFLLADVSLFSWLIMAVVTAGSTGSASLWLG